MLLPPLASLRSFEAAARLRSFTAAAAELGMTQAAVSYQIRQLETRLGAALFLREPQGVRLTERGAALAPATLEAFALLRDAWKPQTGRETLSISTLATIAGNWLAQRLGRFQTENPSIAVRLDVEDRVVDFARADVDVAVRYGKGPWPGLESHRLFGANFTPMMSPELASRVSQPADLLQLPRLDDEDRYWTAWLRAAGLPAPAETGPPRLLLGTQIHEARAAAAGAGVALLSPRFFRLELATGTLVAPFDILADIGKAYWLVYPEGRRHRPAIRALRRFLLAEAAADL